MYIRCILIGDRPFFTSMFQQKFKYVTVLNTCHILLGKKKYSTVFSNGNHPMWEYKKNCSEHQLCSKINSMRTKDTSRRREKAKGTAHGSDWISTHMHLWNAVLTCKGGVVRADGKAKKKKTCECI